MQDKTVLLILEATKLMFCWRGGERTIELFYETLFFNKELQLKMHVIKEQVGVRDILPADFGVQTGIFWLLLKLPNH